MSPDVIAAGVFGIAGVVAGVVIERVARVLGRLGFDASVRKLVLVRGAEDEEGYPMDVPLGEADETTRAEGVDYEFAIDLFNGKEVPTGLRDARIELVRDDGEAIASRPKVLGTGRPAQMQVARQPPRTVYDDLDVVNLPPRQFTVLGLRGGFGEGEAVALRDGRWRSIDLVGEFPSRPILGVLGGRTYRKTVTTPKDWPQP